MDKPIWIAPGTPVINKRSGDRHVFADRYVSRVYWIEETDFSMEDLFDRGVVPEFDREFSAEEKKMLLDGCVEAVGKPLLYTFYLLDCKEFVQAVVTNEANGDMFQLLFKRIHQGENPDRSVATGAAQGTEPR